MIFGVQQPGPITWTTGGTASGSAINSAVAAFVDGRPDTPVRMTWISGVQTTSSAMYLQADWATTQVLRVIALSNLSLPAGTLIKVAFRRSTDTAGTYPYTVTGDTSGGNGSQRIYQLERGEQTCIIVLPVGMTAVQGVQIQFFNDVNGASSIVASSTFTVGEVIIRTGVECDVKPGWSPKRTDPTTKNFANQTPYTNPGSPYRMLSFEFPMDTQTAYYGDPAAPTLIDYEEILALLDRGKNAFYIPRYRTAAGVIDPQILHRTAMLGTMTDMAAVSQKTGLWFDSNSVSVLEIPIPT